MTDQVAWSDEAYRIFGLTPQERTIGFAALQQMVHPDDRAMMSRAVAEALRGGRRYDVEYRAIRPDGEMRIVHEPVVALFDVATGRETKRLSVADEHLAGCAWRPDGKHFAVFTWRQEPTVHFFDAGGKERGKLALPSQPRALSYSPDGKRIIVSLADTTALVYEVPVK